MSATILQAAVGAGKTEAALDRLIQTICNPHNPFARAWVLLATRRQEVAFRQRLVELRLDQRVFFNAEFFNFYELNVRLLNLDGQPQRRINEAARLRILHVIMQQLLRAQQLQVFDSIALTPGFLRVVADFIYELKQNLVYPDTFQQQAISQKDKELALIYAEYQALLQQNYLVDREGEGWLALNAVQQNDVLAADVDLLLVDGYDQFTLVQSVLLAYLAGRVGEVAITLTTVPEREETIGLRFKKTRTRLEEAFSQAGVPLAVTDLPVPPGRPLELQHLGERIFRTSTPLLPPEKPTRVRLIEAPDAATEIAAIFRDIKRLLLAGTAPDEILIAVRDWGRYHTHIETYTRLYGLPVLRHYAEPIERNPAITTLLKVLMLADGAAVGKGFRRRDVLELLRSPYLNVPGFTPQLVDLLDKVSLEKQVMGGRDQWLEAIRKATAGYEDDNGNEVAPLLTVQEESALSLALQDFFDAVTPLPANLLPEYVIWLDRLIGQEPLAEVDEDETPYLMEYTLDILACIRQIDSVEANDIVSLVSRDLNAMQSLKDILRGFVQAQRLVMMIAPDAADHQITWEVFWGELKAAIISHAMPQKTPVRSGRVLITTVNDARGLPHEHVFIPGLSESIFPAPTPEDPLYLDTERRALTARGILLETQADRAADDGLFYELISLPRETLTLSRPTVRDGKPWVESHLWRMAKAVFVPGSLTHTVYKTGQVPDVDSVASLDEALLAVAAGLDEAKPTPEILALYRWLHETHDAWTPVARGYAIESGRMSSAQFDAYSGWLQQPEMIALVEQAIGDNRGWSASQLNDYGACGFRFFANRLLKLEAQEEPDEGLDALQLGLVNHKILEETYRQILDDNLEIVPENQSLALDMLNDVAKIVLADAPDRFQFNVPPQWEQEKAILRRRLSALVENDFSAQAALNKLGTPRRVYALEQAINVRIPIGHGVETIFVRGKIDRIDMIGDGLIVLDYKTGTSKIPTSEMEAGRNFQMMVYLVALETILKRDNLDFYVRGGAFWHIRNLTLSGDLKLYDDSAFMQVIAHPAIQQAQQHIAQYILRAREGFFPVQPNNPDNARCSSYCDFYQLCRVSITNRYKLDFTTASST